MTVEITTKAVDSFFPYQMLWFLVSSPAQYEKLGKDWDKFASRAFRHRTVQADQAGAARTRRTRRRTTDYWNKKRHSEGRPASC